LVFSYLRAAFVCLIIIPKNFSFKNKNVNQASKKGVSPYFEKQKNVPIAIKLKKIA